MTQAVAGLTQSELGKRLEQGLAELGLDLGREAGTKLLEYLALLGKWNQVYNLTAIRDAEKMVSGHLLDCLAAIPHVSGASVLDAGSGAVFPGIPFAIARPESRFTLLDSNHKKAAFLRQAVAELRLKNASVVCERVESWSPAEKFDCIISRALAEIAEFVTLSVHLLAPGGVLAAMKGVHPFEEIGRLPRDFRVMHVHRLAVPGLGAERHLVLIERA